MSKPYNGLVEYLEWVRTQPVPKLTYEEIQEILSRPRPPLRLTLGLEAYKFMQEIFKEEYERRK